MLIPGETVMFNIPLADRFLCSATSPQVYSALIGVHHFTNIAD
jgi:hypothetical protein